MLRQHRHWLRRRALRCPRQRAGKRATKESVCMFVCFLPGCFGRPLCCGSLSRERGQAAARGQHAPRDGAGLLRRALVRDHKQTGREERPVRERQNGDVVLDARHPLLGTKPNSNSNNSKTINYIFVWISCFYVCSKNHMSAYEPPR
jgi:hypothetical protein